MIAINSFWFSLDKVFGAESSTDEIYKNLGCPIIKSIVEGFNGMVSDKSTYWNVGSLNDYRFANEC